MINLFERVDSVILKNFKDYWKDPLINKYFEKEASEEIEGFLILRKNKKPIWFSHPFNYDQVKKEFSPGIIIKKFDNQNDLKKQFSKILGKKVGYNGRFYSYAGITTLKKMFKEKKFIDVSEMLEKEREIKNEKEIKKIKIACIETKKVLSLAKKWLMKGISEKQLKKMIEDKIKKNGFETAFCIVAFEENTKNIHHVSSNKKFSGGAVMIDMGVKNEGYCADITQSWFIGKKELEKEYEKVYSKVVTCCLEIEEKLKPEIKAKELAKISKKINLPHAIGHGIGLEVHDLPSGIGEKSNWKLKEGMVLAIEPAIYTKNFGIRIENNYLITKTGFEKL